MTVSNIDVFSFRLIKAPFFSSLWYVLLCYTIWNPYDTLPTVLGIVLLLLSFTKARFILCALSPIPCIAEMFLVFNYFHESLIPYLTVLFGILWLYFYVLGMIVWYHIAKCHYVLDPVTRHLKYDASYYLQMNLKKNRRQY